MTDNAARHATMLAIPTLLFSERGAI